MICYKDGDIKRGGFRFLTDNTICVDFCDENYPIDLYLKNLVQYINENSIKKIFINGPLAKKIDISFLSDLKLIESLQITANCESLKPINELKLKALKLQIQDETVNFYNLKDCLEEIELYNVSHLNGKKVQLHDSILECKRLKILSVSSFDCDDCNIIKELNWLQTLELANCADKKIEFDWLNELKRLKKLKLQKISLEKLELRDLTILKELILTQLDLTTLDGIQYLNGLEYLNINYCSKLTDISAVSNCVNLRKIEFENVKRVMDFEKLAALKNIEGLIISNCGNIPSIGFINDMPKLRFFSFVDTNIVDGDLTPCLRLEYAGTMNKRHYNIRAEDLPHKLKCTFHDL